MPATSNEPVILLKTAVSHLTDYITNHDLPPQEALQKVSEEFDLAPNFIKRASEAINVALTHSHFKKHAASRDSEFPITDADKVISNIFGGALKTASEHADTAIRVGGKADSFKVNMHKLSSPKYKTAYAEILSAKNDAEQLSIKGVMAKSASLLDTLEKQANEAKDNAVDFEFRMKTVFASTVNDFSKEETTRQSWADFEKQAFAEYGEKATPYVELMYKAAGFKGEPRGQKHAHAVDYTVGRQVEKLGELLTLVEGFQVATKVADEKLSEYTEAKAHVSDSFQEIGKAKLASLYATGNLTILEEIQAEKKAEEKAEKKSEPVVEVDPVAVKAARYEKVAEESKNLFHRLAQGIDFGQKSNGAASAHMDNAKRQQILTELLHEDEILSQADPHQTAQNYLQMVQLSPDLSLQKGIVAAQLRQMSAGQALNPHDATLLSSANSELSKMHQLRNPAPSFSKGDKQGGK